MLGLSSSKQVTVGCTSITTEALSMLCFPCVSVTVSFAWNSPAFVYVCVTVGVDCVTGAEPSPKLNVYDATESPASGSEDPDPSNATCSGTLPDRGEAVSTAVGAVFGAQAAFDSTE